MSPDSPHKVQGTASPDGGSERHTLQRPMPPGRIYVRSRGSHLQRTVVREGACSRGLYQFFVQEQGQYHGPVEIDIARGTGLPTRFVMSEPSTGATMTMRYSDYDRPATIEAPSCLAK